MNVESGIFRCVIELHIAYSVGAASSRQCLTPSYRLVGDHWSITLQNTRLQLV